MNTQAYTSLGMGMMLLANIAAFADDTYAPADYHPKVDYSAPATAEPRVAAEPVIASEAVSATPASASETPAPAVKEDHPLPSKAAEPKSSKAAPAQGTASAANQGSSASSLSDVLLLGALAAAGFFGFRKKHPAKQAMPDAESDAPGRTGVERYLEKLNPQKTGVDKYLERQTKIAPTTGVARYIAKQAVRDNT